MTSIRCYHGDDDVHAMTQIGRSTDDTLVATYADGTRIAIQAPAKHKPVLSFDIGDEPVVRMKDYPMAIATTDDEIETAFKAWLSTDVHAVDEYGYAIAIHQLKKGTLALRNSEGDVLDLPTINSDGLLSAVWHQDRFFGFSYGVGVPLVRANGTFIGANIETVRARLVTIASRLNGEWQVVAGEGERLDTDTSSVRAGAIVKIGIQPLDPMPDDIHAEWMWAEVTKVDGNKVTATLANHPCMFAISLKYGDKIRFEKRDIYAIQGG